MRNFSMEHENPFGTLQPGKRDYLFKSSFFFGNFPVGLTEKRSIYPRTGISGIFGLMGSARSLDVSAELSRGLVSDSHF